MKMTLNKDQFRFQMDQVRPNQFSYEALGTLFDDFEQYEESTGEQVEFDPIAICCEYVEMTLAEFYEAYPDVLDLIDMDRPRESTYSIVVDYLNDNGSYCGDTPQGTFVFQQF
jgi:hypothetical protein